MNVYVNNKKYTLDKQKSISGGEGTVYLLKDIAFKIYHESSKMIPLGKFKELNAIKADNVIKPEELIYDERKNVIGYTMKAIYNTVSLSRIVTTDYQNSHNISHKDLIKIILNIKDTIANIHKNNCLVVDINDSNILVDHKLNVYFIDVDSYKTQNYPATALQDYAKDFTVKDYKFSELSDWFSFGLLATKIWIGIHPFMGRWSKYKKREKQNTLEYRSLNNISIFNEFVDIFEKGERKTPPNDLGEFFSSVDELILDEQNNINFKKLLTNKLPIIRVLQGFRNEVILSNNAIIFQNNITKLKENYTSIVFNSKDEPLIFKINDKNQVESYNVVKQELNVYDQVLSDKIYAFNNQLYAVNYDNFMSLELINFGKETLTIKSSFSIMPYSSQVFDSCIYQNTMGKAFMYLIHDKDTTPLIKFKELDGKKIVNAKYKNNILVVNYKNNFNYTNIIFKVNQFFDKYKVIYHEENDVSNINFTVNDKGVACYIPEDEKMFLFFNQFNNQAIRKIKDGNINLNMKLYSSHSNINVYINNEIYNITMK